MPRCLSRSMVFSVMFAGLSDLMNPSVAWEAQGRTIPLTAALLVEEAASPCREPALPEGREGQWSPSRVWRHEIAPAPGHGRDAPIDGKRQLLDQQLIGYDLVLSRWQS